MKKTSFFMSLLAPVFLFAQRVVNVDKEDGSPLKGNYYIVAGSPVSMAKYVRVIEGSPFFSETWMKAIAYLPNGNEFDNLLVRLDLVANEIHFIGESGKELVATNPLSEIQLTDSLTGEKFHFVHSSAFIAAKAPEPGWYLLLAEGPAVLFKKLQKIINEVRPYGSATYNQTILTASSYFILYNNSFSRIKKFSQITELLNTKNLELSQYISSKKLSGKKENDYIMLVGYFNDLVEYK